jgi:hypothetical protein
MHVASFCIAPDGGAAAAADTHTRATARDNIGARARRNGEIESMCEIVFGNCWDGVIVA